MDLLGNFLENDWLSIKLLTYLIYLFLALTLFQGLGFLGERSGYHPKEWKNYQQRLMTWWIILVPLTATLFLGEHAFMFFWAFVGSLAIREILEVAPLHPTDQPLKFYLMTFPWLYTCAILVDLPMSACLTVGLLVLPLYMCFHGPTDQFLPRISYLVWLFIQIPFFLGFMGWLSHEAPGCNPEMGKAAIPLWVVFVIQFSDAMQYSCGKLLGKRPILPKISPYKTWEGFLLGILLSSVVCAFIAQDLTDLSWLESASLAAIIALAGFLGDITLSSVKRSLEIKDFSELLKGHGGLLDRIDSLLFAAPIAYLILRFYH